MRKVFFVATLCALAGYAPAANAQSTGSWVGSLGAGITLPMGDAGDAMKLGFHGAATIGYHKTDSKLTWLVDAGYHMLGSDLDDDNNYNIFVAMGRVNYWTSANMYVLGGVGMLRNEFKQTVSGVEIDNTHSALALSGGVGFGFGKSLFLEGRLIYSSTDGGSTMLVPVTIGVRF